MNMSEKETDVVDKKSLAGKRTYRVSARIIENFPQISFFVSPTAHRLYHLQQTLFPEYAGKKDLTDVKLPKGFRILDQAIVMKFNRDLANFARNTFHSATLEELIAAKFEEAKGIKKKVELL